MYASLHKMADWLARGMALAGGAILIALTILTCVSITGRALLRLGIGPGSIRGIFDLTEIGIAAAVFAFLPLCQLQRGHATVDLFAPVFPKMLNRALDLVFDVLMLMVAGIGAWRLYLGMLDKYRYTETTFIMQFPVWIAYLASLVGAIAFVLVAAFCVIRSARVLLRLGTDEVSGV